MAELGPGAIFAGHRIEGVVGRGGMGVVYRAMHLALDHEVALKVIAAEVAADETFRARFRDEARSAASIRHPNVVSVRHAGEEDGMWFVTMDLIEGTDLRRRLREQGALDPARAVEITEQVAAALDAAHKRGLVHRDVKPGNILIEETDGEHIFLTDFGLTKRVEDTSGLTRTGMFVGTIDYCAPEQIQRTDITPRTDVYALGCVLFEMLSGLTPFGQAEEDVAKIYAHLQREPPVVSEIAPGVPADFDAVLAQALAKSPDDRFSSAGELASAAREALAGADTAESTVQYAPPTAVTTATDPPTPGPEVATPTEAPTVVTRGAPRATRRQLALVAVAAVLAGIGVVALITGGSGDGDASGAVVGERFPVPGFPVGVAVVGDDVWVGARKGERLVRFVGGQRADPVDVGYRPEGMAVDDRDLFIASSNPGQIDSFSAADLPSRNATIVSATVETGGSLRGVDVLDGVAWAADHDGNRLVRSDSGEPVPVGGGPNGVAAGAGSIWVTNRDDGTVWRVSPSGDQEIDEIQVGREPKGLVFAEGLVWVANTAVGTVSVIDPAGGAEDGEPITVGENPRDVAFGEGYIWVSNGGALREDGSAVGDGSVTQIAPDTREVVATIEVGGSPEDIAVGAGHVWVALGAGDKLVRIDP